MRKPPTGEPCAGEPHARFGGRGRRKPFPTPIAFGINFHRYVLYPVSLLRGSSFFLFNYFGHDFFAERCGHELGVNSLTAGYHDRDIFRTIGDAYALVIANHFEPARATFKN